MDIYVGYLVESWGYLIELEKFPLQISNNLNYVNDIMRFE